MNDQPRHSQESGRWFRCLRPNPSAKARLYCIPFAGGGPMAFRAWPEQAPDVELWAVHLPGRESRMREKAFTDMHALLAELIPAFAAHAEGEFSVFGHSLGATIAFELARGLEAGRQAGPRRLLLSGHGAPSRFQEKEETHSLPHDAFVERIRSFAGTPEAVLNNKELMDIFVPILRADIRLLETFERDPDARVGFPIVALGGKEDPDVPIESMEAWRAHTRCAFEFHAFDGGHFYWLQNPGPLLETIRATLRSPS